MTEYYKEKLDAALEYQDFISDQLRQHGWYLGAYCSRKWQIEHGESASRIEIKYDMRMHDTGNIYIEVAEKGQENKKEFVPSGIMRNDNSVFILIGDYNEAFLFSKHQLQYILENEHYCDAHGIIRRETKTSKGFTYPIREILKDKHHICLYHFKFNKE